MDFDDFLKLVKKGNIQDIQIFKKPIQDKGDDIPHIKNNITQINWLHQIDVLYLPTSTFGYKYCLVCVDVANSKVDAVALKNKDSNSIINGLIKIYNTRNILKLPKILQFDSGSEFKNKEVKEFLKNQNVAFRYTLTNRHRQNSVVEKANNYIGSLIMKYLTLKEIKNKKTSKVWHIHLDKIIKFMNTKIRKPKQINMEDDVVGSNFALDGFAIGQKVRKILDYPINSANNKRLGSVFRAGDQRFSNNIFRIKHIILNPNMPPLYMLNIENTDKIDARVAYTKNQLLPVIQSLK